MIICSPFVHSTSLWELYVCHQTIKHELASTNVRDKHEAQHAFYSNSLNPMHNKIGGNSLSKSVWIPNTHLQYFSVKCYAWCRKHGLKSPNTKRWSAKKQMLWSSWWCEDDGPEPHMSMCNKIVIKTTMAMGCSLCTGVVDFMCQIWVTYQHSCWFLDGCSLILENIFFDVGLLNPIFCF